MLPRLAVILPVLALTAATELRAGTREESHEFWVGANSSVTLETYRGNIMVEESENPRIGVTVHLEAPGDDEKKVNERLARAEVAMAQNGSAVKVEVIEPKHRKIHFDWVDDGRLDILITLRVPKHCAVSISTQDGGIETANIVADLKARVRVGSIAIRQVDGTIDALTNKGGVTLSRCSGDARLKTITGDIQAGRIGGKAELRTDSGDVELQQAVGGCDVFAEAGEIVAGFPKGFTGENRLHTNGGNVTAKFDLSAKATIDASSSIFGHVGTSLPLVVVSGKPNSSSLQANLNGGGPTVSIRAAGGQVKLLPGSFIEAP